MKKLFVSALVVFGLVFWGCESEFPGDMSLDGSEEELPLKSVNPDDIGHPTTGDVTGVVCYLGTEIPIPEVNIKIGESCTVSGADGTFCLEDVPAGNYSLEACRDDYSACIKKVSISHSEDESIHLAMTSQLYSAKVYGVINGKQTGNPMKDLTLTVLNPNGSESQLNAVTEHNGAFSITAVPLGARAIIVKLGDEEISKEEISLAGNEFELNLEVSDMFNFRDDRDGRVYKALRIGDQTWMAENLAFREYPEPSMKSANADPGDHLIDEDGFSYEDEVVPGIRKKYGLLYTFDEAQKACPSGWHVPTDEEWKVMEKNLGMSTVEADSRGRRESKGEANKIKSVEFWNDNGNGNNQSGFNAQPAGKHTEFGKKMKSGSNAYFWTSTSITSKSAWYRDVYFAKDGINRLFSNKAAGFSVRCVKN